MNEYARGMYLHLKVISKNKEEGSFVGEDLETKSIYHNMEIDNFHFYII